MLNCHPDGSTSTYPKNKPWLGKASFSRTAVTPSVRIRGVGQEGRDVSLASPQSAVRSVEVRVNTNTSLGLLGCCTAALVWNHK